MTSPWQRFVDYLRPVPPPEYGLLHRRADGPAFAVIAEGDAFDFRVHPSYTWTSEGLDPEALEYWSHQFADRAHRDLMRTAAALGRTFPPHHARELERRLNAELQRGSRYERDGVGLTCRAQVRIVPDERIRQRLRPYWERRIEMEYEHELGMQRASLVEERTRRWSAVLASLRDSPFAPQAARLTEEDFAAVYENLGDEQWKAIDKVFELLDGAASNYATAGPYEFFSAFDLAVNSAKQHLEDYRRPPAPAARSNGNGRRTSS